MYSINHVSKIQSTLPAQDDQQSQNNIFIRLAEEDMIAKSIRVYGVTFLKENTQHFIKIFSKGRIKDKDRVHIFKELTIGDNYIVYDGLEILIKQEEFIPPVASSEFRPSLYSNFSIIVFAENNTHIPTENYMTILEKFGMEAQKYYLENILEKIKIENKTTIYIWDEYWETLEKRGVRKLSTVYLNGREQSIYEDVKNFLSKETKAEYEELGIPYKYNILFHGIPGTGKTSLIYSIASELKMDIALISFGKKMEDADLMRALRRVPNNTILVIEDIDGLFESRKKNDECKNSITFSGLLNGMDGIGFCEEQVIFMTTNHKMVLDSALRRPGRIDKEVEFTYCDKKQMKTMFYKFLTQYEDNTEIFESFYKAIKHKKYTPAMLQQYFFAHRKDDNILDSVEEIIELANNNNYDNSGVTLYT